MYNKPLSWSSIASFQYNKESWYKKYILKEKQEDSEQMLFGKAVGSALANDKNFLPEVPRYSVFEKELKAKIGDIKLIGYLDSFDPETKAFIEYKTSSNKKKWTKKTAQEHGQILLYLFLIWKNYGIPPENVDVSLIYIPVNDKGDFSMEISPDEEIQIFEVNHTTVEVLRFAQFIKDIYKEMQLYTAEHEAVVVK